MLEFAGTELYVLFAVIGVLAYSMLRSSGEGTSHGWDGLAKELSKED